MFGPDVFSPLDTWCKLKCIKDNDDCMFTESCGYRGRFLDLISKKQRSAIKRFLKYNGNGYSDRSYIGMNDLVGLARVYLMTGFKCWYCGTPMVVGGGEYVREDSNSFSLDHRVPLACGGTNHINNFVYCCMKCNIEKGGEMQSLPNDSHMRLAISDVWCEE